jgi:serine/threonine protein kinase
MTPERRLELGPRPHRSAARRGRNRAGIHGVRHATGSYCWDQSCRQEFSNRFKREARKISGLNHPHICTLYDVGPRLLGDGIVKRRLWLRACQEGPSRRSSLRYASQIAEALAAAHIHGLIDRHLKSANIIVTKAAVKVLDFAGEAHPE